MRIEDFCKVVKDKCVAKDIRFARDLQAFTGLDYQVCLRIYNNKPISLKNFGVLCEKLEIKIE